MSVSPTSALQVLHEKLGKAGALEVIRSHRETHITKAISEVDNSQIVSKFQKFFAVFNQIFRSF